MNLLSDAQKIETHVHVIDRDIPTIINQVFYDHENNFVDVQYSFDERFYSSEDVEWLNADRLNVFEKNLRNMVYTTLKRIIRWEELKYATA